jgi:hypothetical protein
MLADPDGYAAGMDDNAELHEDLREHAAEPDAHGAEDAWVEEKAREISVADPAQS